MDAKLLGIFTTTICSLVIITLMFFTACILKPCVEPFLGSVLLDCSGGSKSVEMSLKVIIIAGIEGYHWWTLCSTVVLIQILATAYTAVIVDMLIELSKRYGENIISLLSLSKILF